MTDRGLRRRQAMVLCVLVVALVALGGCGGDDPPERGTLSITQTRQPDRPLGIEGSASYVLVKDGTETLADARVTGREAMGTADLLMRSLPPGEYRVIGFQRYCGADACMTYPPSGRRVAQCSGPTTVVAGETTQVEIALRVAGRPTCEVE